MPVYEFYCADCHTIFSFISSRVDTVTTPACPRCKRRELERQVSRFAVSKGRTDNDDDQMPEFDESRMEQAIASMAAEMEGLDENDPRQMAQLMRKLTEAGGLDLGGGVEEALRRLESGEDPDRIEEEMGDLLETENPFLKQGLKGMKRKYVPPAHDDRLYRL